MVINALASLFDTPGDTPPSDRPLNRQMKLAHVNVNSSSVIFSSSRTLSPRKKFSMRTTTLSGLTLDSIMKTRVSPPGGNTPVEHQCCGGIDAPWYWISVKSNKCCNQSPTSSGVVVGKDDQC